MVKIEYEMKKKGVIVMFFDIMVFIGKNGVLLYGILGEIKIKKGDLVLFDLGVVYKGYCFDIICIVVFGDIFDE